jgi:signal transduction histidine kinase
MRNAIIEAMTIKHHTSEFNITSGTDLAFALVVLISYFTSFTKAPEVSVFLITVLVFLGVAYIANGIYGFAYVNQSDKLAPKLLYFGIQLMLGGLIIFFSKGGGFNAYILLPLAAHTAMTLTQDWIFATNIGIFMVYVLSVISYSNNWAAVWAGFPVFFVGQVFILIFTQTAVTEQRGRIEMEKLAQQLTDANQHLSDYAKQVKGLTITQERNRFAREIHDGLGHYLTTINMQIKAAQAIMKKDPRQADQLLEKAEQLSSEALLDVRNSVESLREGSDTPLSLDERIRRLIETSKIKNREYIFNIKGSIREIQPQVNVTLFRSVQEAINNANKHSKSSLVEINLSFEDPKQVCLSIFDNGIGAEFPEGGFGLIGMKERVQLIHGDINITTGAGKGFLIEITVPG